VAANLYGGGAERDKSNTAANTARKMIARRPNNSQERTVPPIKRSLRRRLCGHKPPVGELPEGDCGGGLGFPEAT